MFRGMTRLETAEGLGLLNTSRLISLQETFYDCTNLIELDLSRFCTPKVQGMEKMFCNCKKLKRLDLRGFDLAVIRDMRSMFEGCCSLEEIYIDADRFGLILFSAVKVNKLFQDSNPSGVIYEMRRRKDDGPTE